MRRIALLGTAVLALLALVPARADAWSLEADKVYSSLVAVAPDGTTFAAVRGPRGGGLQLDDTASGATRFVAVDAPVRALAGDGAGGWLVALETTGPVLRRIGPDGRLDPAFASTVTGDVLGLVVSSGTAFVATATSDPSVGPVLRTVDAATGAPRALAPAFDRTIEGIAAADGVVYVSGDFGTVDGVPRAGIAAFDAATLALLPFVPTGLDVFRGGPIAVGPTDVVVSGSFAVGGTDATLVAIDRATGATRALLTSEQDPGVEIRSLAVDGTTLVLGGSFASIRGVTRQGAAALDLPSGSVLPFDPRLTALRGDEVDVTRVAVGNGTVTLTGFFARARGKPRAGAARVDLATGRPTAWAPALLDPTALAVAGDAVLAPLALRKAAGIAAVDADGGLRWLSPVVADSYRLATDGTRVFLGLGGTSVKRRTLLVAAVAADTGAPLWQASLPTPKPKGSGSRPISGYVVSLVPGDGELLVLATFTTGAVYARLDPATGRVLVARSIPSELGLPGPRDRFGNPPRLVPGSLATLAPVGRTVYVGGAARVERLVPGQVRGRAQLVQQTTSTVIALDRRSGRVLGPRLAPVAGWRGVPAPAIIRDLSPTFVSRLLVAGDRIVLVGRFTSVGGKARTSGLAVLSLLSGAVTPFDPKLALNRVGAVRGLAVCGDTLVVTGDFRRAAGQARPEAAAFDLATGSLLPWSPSGPRLGVLRAAGSALVGVTVDGFTLGTIPDLAVSGPCVAAEGGPEASASQVSLR